MLHPPHSASKSERCSANIALGRCRICMWVSESAWHASTHANSHKCVYFLLYLTVRLSLCMGQSLWIFSHSLSYMIFWIFCCLEWSIHAASFSLHTRCHWGRQIDAEHCWPGRRLHQPHWRGVSNPSAQVGLSKNSACKNRGNSSVYCRLGCDVRL